MTIDPGAVLAWLGQNLFVLLVPYLVWQTNALRQVTQTIYGVKGDNGLLGSVRDLKTRTNEHGTILQRHDGQLERHKERLDGHDHQFSDLRAR